MLLATEPSPWLYTPLCPAGPVMRENLCLFFLTPPKEWHPFSMTLYHCETAALWIKFPSPVFEYTFPWICSRRQLPGRNLLIDLPLNSEIRGHTPHILTSFHGIPNSHYCILGSILNSGDILDIFLQSFQLLQLIIYPCIDCLPGLMLLPVTPNSPFWESPFSTQLLGWEKADSFLPTHPQTASAWQ